MIYGFLVSRFDKTVIAIVSTCFDGLCGGVSKALGFAELLLEKGVEILESQGLRGVVDNAKRASLKQSERE